MTLVEPTKYSAVVYGLKAYTLYSVCIRAQTVESPGTYSSKLSFQTKGYCKFSQFLEIFYVSQLHSLNKSFSELTIVKKQLG